MTKHDYDGLKEILLEREKGERFIRVDFEFSEDPEHGLYLSEPILEGLPLCIGEEFQEELKEIFREAVEREGEIPQHVCLMISYAKHHDSIKVSAYIVGSGACYTRFYSA